MTSASGRSGPDANDLPLISVVVPFFRDEKYISTCLESIQSQQGVELEILAIDDRGGDRSAEAVRGAMACDERVRLIRHEANLGLAASRNTGIAHARGELITFLDADDFLFADSLYSRARRLVYKSRWDSVIGGSYCGWEMVPEQAVHTQEPAGEPKNERLRYMRVAGNNPLIATAPLLWKWTALDVGGFDESFSTAEDFEFWTRYLRQGYHLIPTGSVGVAYRQKQTGMIADGLVEHAMAAARVFEYIDRPLEEHEVSRRAPHPFIHPWATHSRNSTWLRRLTVFLVIAEATNNTSEADGLLALLPEAITPTDLVTETGLEAAVRAGITRFELQHATLEPERAATLSERVKERLQSAIGMPRVGAREDSLLRFDEATCRSRAVEEAR